MGEHIPALDIAAKSVGVTTQEFTEMLKKGEVLAKDFLPKFAKELRKVVRENGSLEAGMKKIVAQQARMTNAFKFMIDDIFQGRGAKAMGNFFESISMLIERLSPVLVDISSILFDVFTVVTDVTGAVLRLADSLFSTATSGISMWDSFLALWNEIVAQIYLALAGFESIKKVFTDLDFQQLGEMGQTFMSRMTFGLSDRATAFGESLLGGATEQPQGTVVNNYMENPVFNDTADFLNETANQLNY